MWTKLLSRLNSIFKAKANDALDRAEDPVQMVKLAVAEMEVSVSKSTEALAKAMANQKMLQNKYEALKSEAEGWMGKATAAMRNNQEELGRKALEKKALVDQQLVHYEQLTLNGIQTVDTLKNQLDRMKGKLDEAKAKQSILIAKAENAKAQNDIAKQLGGISGSALSDFSKYEEKINQLEAQAQSLTELTEHTDRLEREFTQLESDSKIHNDYEAIKAQLALEQKQKDDLEEKKKNERIEKMINSLPATDAKIVSTSPEEHFEKLNPPKKDDEHPNQKHIDNFFNQ